MLTTSNSSNSLQCFPNYTQTEVGNPPHISVRARKARRKNEDGWEPLKLTPENLPLIFELFSPRVSNACAIAVAHANDNTRFRWCISSRAARVCETISPEARKAISAKLGAHIHHAAPLCLYLRAWREEALLEDVTSYLDESFVAA